MKNAMTKIQETKTDVLALDKLNRLDHVIILIPHDLFVNFKLVLHHIKKKLWSVITQMVK